MERLFSKMTLEAIRYTRGHLEILDQLRLPHVTQYETIKSSEDAWQAIKAMRVRGAPAIAIVAALAIAVELATLKNDPHVSYKAEGVRALVVKKLEYLLSSRPTAVNLADAVRKLTRVASEAAQRPRAEGAQVIDAYLQAAEQMLVDDVKDNEGIGRYGADWILKNASSDPKDSTVSVLTHCNTG